MTATEDPQPKVRRSAPPPPSKAASASSAVVANPAAPAPAVPAIESETVSPVVATAGGVNPGEEFDPFGAPMVANVNAAPGNVATTQGASYIDAPSAAASQAHPKAASFDEDDFDFSDLPPLRSNLVSPWQLFSNLRPVLEGRLRLVVSMMSLPRLTMSSKSLKSSLQATDRRILVAIRVMRW